MNVRCFTLLALVGGTAALGQAPAEEQPRSATNTDQLALRAAQASRSDSIDILHTLIDLDLTQVGSDVIAGHASLRWTPKVPGIDHLPLDLLALTVDSVTDANGQLAFVQTGELIDIDLGAAHDPSDTLITTVHYHGDPVIDGGGWGGFYTSGNVIYDLGVAFQSLPHSFGRSWFPCFDNFVERCTFEFIVRTSNNRHAWCNGTMLGETDLGGGQWQSHWISDETMPSYLASVTASTYAAVRDTFPSISGASVPVDLVAQPSDTTDLKNSFTHLQDAFDCFEQWFGRHRWDRVGYCLTPQGAMEHATNISFPSFIIDGSLSPEGTMAHELSHHWWGDLVTCDRVEEMYINEGFAEYGSYLFFEAVYGHENYTKRIRDNHRAMVHRSHLEDQGWWALVDMPQEWTYGTITYSKGADVLHSLRNYLGDSLFREGLTSFLDSYAFEAVNSLQLRDHLTLVTGVPLDDYFNDWIFQPGWAAFEVDSFSVSGSAPNYNVSVYIEQKLRGPANWYHNVPITLNEMDGAGNTQLDTVLLGDQFTTVNITTSFAPSRIGLNEDERISLAITQDIDTITATSIFTYAHADLRLDVNVLPAPARLVMQEYWVAADDNAAETFAYVISPDRWWRVGGELAPGTQIDGRIVFDGRPTIGSSIDLGLVQDLAGLAFHEDSIVLLYRPDASSAWSEFPTFTVNTQGGPTDGFGRIDFTGFTTGDYTFGWRKSAVGLKPVPVANGEWVVGPNPASDRIKVEWKGDGPPLSGRLELLDTAGKVLLTRDVRDQRRTVLELDPLMTGQLILRFIDEQGAFWPAQKITVLK